MAMYWDEEQGLWIVQWHNWIVARFTIESMAAAFIAASGY